MEDEQARSLGSEMLAEVNRQNPLSIHKTIQKQLINLQVGQQTLPLQVLSM